MVGEVNYCPSCMSNNVKKYGFAEYKGVKRQRYYCVDCRRITIHLLSHRPTKKLLTEDRVREIVREELNMRM